MGDFLNFFFSFCAASDGGAPLFKAFITQQRLPPNSKHQTGSFVLPKSAFSG